MYSRWRRAFSAFSAAVRFRFPIHEIWQKAGKNTDFSTITSSKTRHASSPDAATADTPDFVRKKTRMLQA
jgi:hypothetical protein